MGVVRPDTRRFVSGRRLDAPKSTFFSNAFQIQAFLESKRRLKYRKALP